MKHLLALLAVLGFVAAALSASAERQLLKGNQGGDGGDLKTASSFIGPFGYGYGYGYPYFGYGWGWGGFGYPYWG